MREQFVYFSFIKILNWILFVTISWNSQRKIQRRFFDIIFSRRDRLASPNRIIDTQSRSSIWSCTDFNDSLLSEVTHDDNALFRNNHVSTSRWKIRPSIPFIILALVHAVNVLGDDQVAQQMTSLSTHGIAHRLINFRHVFTLIARD